MPFRGVPRAISIACLSLLALGCGPAGSLPGSPAVPAATNPATSSGSSAGPTASVPPAKSSFVSADEIQRLRTELRKGGNVAGEYPKGWSKSKQDPTAMLSALPSLRLKKGWVLGAYVYREGGNGNGIVWAMPEGATFPEPKEIPTTKDAYFGLSRPQGAIELMEAVEGDGLPLSYLSASLLSRDARDYAAQWHGIGWGWHRVLDSDPIDTQRPPNKELGSGPTGGPADWKWKGPKPMEWRPQVEMSGDVVKVTFYTFSPHQTQRIYKHVDIYRAGSYLPQSQMEDVAEGPPGLMV